MAEFSLTLQRVFDFALHIALVTRVLPQPSVDNDGRGVASGERRASILFLL
jgi:hypothetical protein